MSIVITDDDAIRELNRDYRGKDIPTDVLSFSMLEGESFPEVERQTGPILGDIVISQETALRYAEAEGIPPQHEMMRLMVHGFLHLIGFDHERGPDDARAMQVEEERILAHLVAAFPDWQGGIPHPKTQV